MTADPQAVDALQLILQRLASPWWSKWDVYVGLLISAAGLIFSYRAFIEAKRAVKAATAAGRTVKIQTTAIELTEIALRLDRIEPDIHFSDARDFLSEVSRRLRRATAPFLQDESLKDPAIALRDALTSAHEALKSVRPADPAKEGEAPFAVYYAIESHFSIISDSVADLLGLCERETFDIGDQDGES